MFIHTSVFVYIWIYGSTYLYKYWGMCIHIFITMIIHVYKYIHIDSTCSCGGTSQRFGVGPSEWVVLVPPCKSVVTEFPWYVHDWNQHGLVSKCGAFCKLGFEILPIVDEFVGDVEHFAQHCIGCTWLWPPSQYPAFIQQDHFPKDLPGENIGSHTLLDLPVTHIQHI